MKKIKVLFICMGNICRSPLAKGVMKHLVRESGLDKVFEIDSAGTISFHEGGHADHRSIIVAKNHGIQMQHIARQVKLDDLDYFDYIMIMDKKNHQDLLAISDEYEHKIHYLREYDIDSRGDLTVPDPYYGDVKDFELTYQLCYRSVEGFIRFLQEQNKI